jgi:hypothetical protein
MVRRQFEEKSRSLAALGMTGLGLTRVGRSLYGHASKGGGSSRFRSVWLIPQHPPLPPVAALAGDHKSTERTAGYGHGSERRGPLPHGHGSVGPALEEQIPFAVLGMTQA